MSTPPTAGENVEPAIVGISGFVLGGKRHLGPVLFAQQQWLMGGRPELLFFNSETKCKTNQMLQIYENDFKAATIELFQ